MSSAVTKCRGNIVQSRLPASGPHASRASPSGCASNGTRVTSSSMPWRCANSALGMILDAILAERAVGHALLARVDPANAGSIPLDALSAKASDIVPVGAIASKWLLRMPCPGESRALMSSGKRDAKRGAARYVLRIEQRKRALLLGELDRSPVRRVAHLARDRRCHASALRRRRNEAPSISNASPRPVKPRPMRRLAAASCRCSGNGQTVASSTSSSIRTATGDDRAQCSEVEAAAPG